MLGMLHTLCYIIGMKEDNEKSSGLGFGTVLFLIFLTSKLANVGMVATWSWWWVFSPLWIPILIVGVVSLILVWLNR